MTAVMWGWLPAGHCSYEGAALASPISATAFTKGRSHGAVFAYLSGLCSPPCVGSNTSPGHLSCPAWQLRPVGGRHLMVMHYLITLVSADGVASSSACFAQVHSWRAARTEAMPVWRFGFCIGGFSDLAAPQQWEGCIILCALKQPRIHTANFTALHLVSVHGWLLYTIGCTTHL